MRWLNPASSTFPVIEGRFWHTDLTNFYDRLPSKAKKMARSDVWQLAQNTAGEYIKFKTNSSEIIVRYTVWAPHDMPHMPATGVSGIDLYALDQNKNWNWAAGSYSFSDTIEYKFINIKSPALIKEFRLYLPLYNTPIWMHIGVANNAAFEFLQSPQSVH